MKKRKFFAQLIMSSFCIVYLNSSFYFTGKYKSYHFYEISSSISLTGIHDKVISEIEIKNSDKNCIQLSNCYNIKIENCRLISAKGNGIDLYRCKNVTIQNCYIENIATGVYALESTGINVSHNQVKNVKGPFPRGQMVQFNDVSGANNVVSYNRCENFLSASYPEDIINMYKTNGTVDSPVKITGNWIRGGGPSPTGGGIMLGDNGGSYLIAKDNILVNPGQYGIAIAGGTHNQILNNKIYSKKQPFTNVGLYVWNQYLSACALNSVSGNQVNWTNAKGELNGSWDNGNCGAVEGWSTNNFNAQIDFAILPVKIVTQ